MLRYLKVHLEVMHIVDACGCHTTGGYTLEITHVVDLRSISKLRTKLMLRYLKVHLEVMHIVDACGCHAA